jgi:hypothetical protein
MKSKSFQLGLTPALHFRACTGDLRIHSWDLAEVQLLLRRETDTVTAQEMEGGLEISGSMPATVHVPQGASVVLETCVGDVHAVGISSLRLTTHRGDLALHQVGLVTLDCVHGDVLVREARTLSLSVLHGDLKVRGVTDALHITDVHGDISLKQVSGQTRMHNVTGDVDIRSPEGDFHTEAVTGDLRLAGSIHSGEYLIEALGDIAVRLDPLSDVRVELEARAGIVESKMLLRDSSESGGRLTGTLGAGTALLRATSGGDMRLSGPGADERADWPDVETAQTSAHVRRAVERASRFRRVQARWSGGRPTEPSETLQDERLAILKMLADGKISADQAAELLGSLEP